ncbi:MAG: exosome complex RNA-binding protein Csl4 [Candidatus Micrarchaeota archaeon]
MERSNFAIPGKHVGTIEEALPSRGTREENHEIYATLSGQIIREHGEISVISKKEILPIQPSQIVYGIVIDVMDQLALVEIEPIIRGRERFVPPSDYGVLRVMNIRDGFVPSAKNEMKRGDLIKARVEELKLGISLSTKAFDLGIVRAYCDICRNEMNLIDSILKCSKCGRVCKRKISKSYGHEIMLNEIKI